MTGRRTTAIVVAVLVAAATIAWLRIAEVGRVEGPGDPHAVRDEIAVTGFRRVATPDSAAVLVGPPGVSDFRSRVTGPGSPIGSATSMAALTPALRDALVGIGSGVAEGDCDVQFARFRPDALPRDLLAAWSVPESDVDSTVAGRTDLLYAWVSCGSGP